MRKQIRYGLVATAFLALIAVRFIAQWMWDDPLIPYFKLPDYSTQPFPEIQEFSFGCYLTIRYAINALLSAVILHLLFPRKGLLQFLTLTFLLFWAIGMILLFAQLNGEDPNFNGLLFARRILMHPILLLVLLPALYYQQFQEQSVQRKNRGS